MNSDDGYKQDAPANETGPPIFVLQNGCPIISVSHKICLLLLEFLKKSVPDEDSSNMSIGLDDNHHTHAQSAHAIVFTSLRLIIL
jgi:hypothetical protein